MGSFGNAQQLKKTMMKILKKILGIFMIISVLGIAYVWFFVYNKPHRNFDKAKPDVILSAQSFYNNYAKKIKSCNGKVVQINGIPKKIETNDSLAVVVFVFDQGMFGDEGVRCTMLPKYRNSAENLDLSKTVTIKGFCAGYNGTDVILEQCSIIK